MVGKLLDMAGRAGVRLAQTDLYDRAQRKLVIDAAHCKIVSSHTLHSFAALVQDLISRTASEDLPDKVMELFEAAQTTANPGDKVERVVIQ